jgi:hypothetical protein
MTDLTDDFAASHSTRFSLWQPRGIKMLVDLTKNFVSYTIIFALHVAYTVAFYTLSAHVYSSPRISV